MYSIIKKIWQSIKSDVYIEVSEEMNIYDQQYNKFTRAFNMFIKQKNEYEMKLIDYK